MKKKLPGILAALLYGCLLCALLYLQFQVISGALDRALANGATLLLALPSILVFAQSHDSTKENAASKQPTPEQLRPFVYAFLRECALSPRETEVAWLIYRGYTNLQIGEELYISETTVKKHASHIYEKMEIGGRRQLREKINGGIEGMF